MKDGIPDRERLLSLLPKGMYGYQYLTTEELQQVADGKQLLPDRIVQKEVKPIQQLRLL